MKMIRLFILPVLLLFVLAVGMGAAPASAANVPAGSQTSYEGNRIYFHGIRVDHLDYLEFYRLHLPLSQIAGDRFIMGDFANGNVNANTLRALTVSRSTRDVEILVRIGFSSQRVRSTFGNRDIFFMVNTMVRLPQRPSGIMFGNNWRNMTFLEAPVISLSNNYWQRLRHFTPQDFGRATIELIVGNRMYPLASNISFWAWNDNNYTFNVPRVETGVVHRPPSVVDPNDPDFDEDEGNTGTNVTPPDQPPPIAGDGGGNGFTRMLTIIATFFGISLLGLQAGLIIVGVLLVLIFVGIPLLKKIKQSLS